MVFTCKICQNKYQSASSLQDHSNQQQATHATHATSTSTFWRNHYSVELQKPKHIQRLMIPMPNFQTITSQRWSRVISHKRITNMLSFKEDQLTLPTLIHKVMLLRTWNTGDDDPPRIKNFGSVSGNASTCTCGSY